MSSLIPNSSAAVVIDSEQVRKQKSVLLIMPATKLFAGEDFTGSLIFSLAQTLAKAQHKVSLLVLDHGTMSKEAVAKFTEQCASSFLSLRYIVRDKYVHFAGQKCACDSYLVYQWLLENETFDVVHFPEYTGLGYYSQLAKRQGLSFKSTQFIIDIFGPSMWRTTVSQSFVTSPDLLAINFLERESVKLADAVFSPLPLYLDILKSESWTLPMSQYHFQLSHAKKRNATSGGEKDNNLVKNNASVIEEIVYLGVMEERDGISIFCDSLDSLASVISESCSITFLGSSSATAGRNAESYIAVRAQKWPWSWQFIHTEQQSESIDYLKNGAKLAVFGSSTTSSLLLAYQCMLNGIPCLCNEDSTGKITSDFSTLAPSFFSTEAELSNKLQMLQAGKGEQVQTTVLSSEHKHWWVDAHQNIFQATSTDQENQVEEPLVTVCMAHYNRPHYLRMALDSLKSQDYKNIEVIVADDGSTASGVKEELDILENEISDRGWKILRLPHKNVGATRSAAAAAATGKFLLFMDDDNFAYPHEISTLIKIAQTTNADIVTCFFDAFEGDVLPEKGQRPVYRKIFLGPAIECGLTENVFGDANALIKRLLYFELGGFEDAPGVAWQDWTFFARAILQGANLQVAPIPLLWYRVVANSMNRTSNEWRSAQSIIKEYQDAMPVPLKYLPSLLYGLIKNPLETQQGEQTVPQTSAVAAIPLMDGNPRIDQPEKFGANTQNEISNPSKVTSEPKQIEEQALDGGLQGMAVEGKAAPSMKQRLASNKFLLYCWWFLTWQLPLRLHEQQTALKLFEARVKQLAMTDLFDARWYRSKYGAAISDPIAHYLTTGASSGNEPGPGFNSRWYLERSPEARSADTTLLEHYLQHGSPAGISATPQSDPDFADFDEEWYVQSNPDIASIQISPFMHYLLYGKAEGRSPNASLDIDPAWYLARYPEVADSGVDPLEHYMTKGRHEGKVPRAQDDPEGLGFDEYWYCQRYPDLAESTVPPLMHYLIYGRQEGRLKRPLDGPDSVAKAISQRFPNQEPLRLFSVPKLPARVTLLLDSVNSGLYGRNATAIIFAALWSEDLNMPLRIVVRNEIARAATVQTLLSAHGIGMSKAIEFATYNDREDSSQLPCGVSEIFVTAGWRNTSSVAKVIPSEQIVYIIQEDERILDSSRDEYLRCSEMLSNQKIQFVINSHLLQNHLVLQGFSHLKNSVVFEPAFPENLFFKEKTARAGEKKNFFFYARPDNPSNLYYRGLEVISQALEQQLLRHTDWNFHFVGTDLALVKLPGGVTPTFAQNLDWAGYAKVVRTIDLGLSLNLTSHPGYPSLELAASGAVVVTNTYANKVSLESYSKNILSAEPSVEALVKAIESGVALSNKLEQCNNNFAENDINKDWQTSLMPVFKALKKG